MTATDFVPTADANSPPDPTAFLTDKERSDRNLARIQQRRNETRAKDGLSPLAEPRPFTPIPDAEAIDAPIVDVDAYERMLKARFHKRQAENKVQRQAAIAAAETSDPLAVLSIADAGARFNPLVKAPDGSFEPGRTEILVTAAGVGKLDESPLRESKAAALAQLAANRDEFNSDPSYRKYGELSARLAEARQAHAEAVVAANLSQAAVDDAIANNVNVEQCEKSTGKARQFAATLANRVSVLEKLTADAKRTAERELADRLEQLRAELFAKSQQDMNERAAAMAAAIAEHFTGYCVARDLRAVLQPATPKTPSIVKRFSQLPEPKGD